MYQMKMLASYWRGNPFFIHILDEKTIQDGIISTGWLLISFKNFYCCSLKLDRWEAVWFDNVS